MPHCGKLVSAGVHELEEVQLEDGCDAAENGLVCPFAEDQESVEKLVDGGDGCGQFGPEVLSDGIQHDCGDDAADDVAGDAVGNPVHPVENFGLELCAVESLELFLLGVPPDGSLQLRDALSVGCAFGGGLGVIVEVIQSFCDVFLILCCHDSFSFSF